MRATISPNITSWSTFIYHIGHLKHHHQFHLGHMGNIIPCNCNCSYTCSLTKSLSTSQGWKHWQKACVVTIAYWKGIISVKALFWYVHTNWLLQIRHSVKLMLCNLKDEGSNLKWQVLHASYTSLYSIYIHVLRLRSYTHISQLNNGFTSSRSMMHNVSANHS